MRLLALFAIFSIVATICLGIWFPESPYAKSVANDSLRQPSVHLMLEGTGNIPPDSILKVLPLDRSPLWWHLHNHEIEIAALRHPAIKSASLSRCSGISISCFRLQIEERLARLEANIGGRLWTIYDDGALQPSDASGNSGKILPIVKGLWIGPQDEAASNTVAKLRLQFALKLEELLSAGISRGRLPYALESLEFLDSGEVRLHLSGTPAAIIMSQQNSEATVEEELQRLWAILKDLNSSENSKIGNSASATLRSRNANSHKEVALIDLAHKRQAVIRFRGD